jgi:hypothetical protein
VVFECSKFSSDRQELYYDGFLDQWSLKKTKSGNSFLNPICPMAYLIEQCNFDETLAACMEVIKTNEKGIKST